MRRLTLRAGVVILASSLGAGLAIATGCADEIITVQAPAPDAAARDAKPDRGAAGDDDDDDSTAFPDAIAPKPKDGGSDATATTDAADAAPKLMRDANGPGEAGAECSFNQDCQLTLRCECDGLCACMAGARGKGKNGIDTCDSGDQCASAVCVEGSGGSFFCSGECLTLADCEAKLPRCADIALVGRICVRQP